MITNHLDQDYINNNAARAMDLLLRSYNSVHISKQGLESIKSLGTNSLFFVSNHLSHLDYGMIPFSLHQHGIQYPRILAGTNLLEGILAEVVKFGTKMDYARAGAVPIKRGASRADLMGVCKTLEMMVRGGMPVLIFPEVKREEDGKMKTGRSYTGELNEFSPMVFVSVKSAAKNSDKPVYIIPLSISYDFVAEDKFFPGLIDASRMIQSGNSLKQRFGKLYYAFLEGTFFLDIYNHGMGDVHINIGNPILVNPKDDTRDLAQNTWNETARVQHITTVALISHFLDKGIITYDELDRKYDLARNALKEKGIHFHDLPGGWKIFNNSLKQMQHRGLLTLRSGEIHVKEPKVITYYSNTIKHHKIVY